jgi:hypothetical protein
MKRACLVVLVASVFAGISLAGAVGLDEPGGVPGSTVRTEIRRGAHEAAACALKAGPDNVKLAECVYGVHVYALSQESGTMPFMLGLFFDGWLHAAASPDVNNRWSAERVARDFFFIAKRHVRDLGLDLETVCRAAEDDCNRVVPVWKEWEERSEQPARISQID